MPLQTNALSTLQEAKDYLQITGTSDDAQITDAINRASDYVETATNSLLARRVWSGRMPAPESCHLSPKLIPIDVTQTITITLAGTAQTIWKTSADDPRSGKDIIVISDGIEDTHWRPNAFYRGAGWGCNDSDPEPVELSFTGGLLLADLPQEIRDAFFLVLGKFYRDQKHQNPDTISFTSPAGTMTRADTDIPRRAQEILKMHRRIPV